MRVKIYKAVMVLAATILLASCGNKDDKKVELEEVSTKVEEKEINKKTSVNFKPKKTSYIKDTTTEVLIEAEEANKEDIAKIVKHGDHWHVFTNDGKEYITYKDPNKANSVKELNDVVDVKSVEDIKGSDVVAIKVHGNHWHIYTGDGEEFLTYEDPSSMYPNIKITEYEGSHGDGDELAYDEENRKHSNNGNGDGGDSSNNKDKSKNKNSLSNNGKQNSSNKAGNKPDKKLHFISIISLKKLKTLDVDYILQHGDHWHVYTKDGTEYITRHNPRKVLPNIEIGQFEGEHGDNKNHGNGETQKTPDNKKISSDSNKKVTDNKKNIPDSKPAVPDGKPEVQENKEPKVIKIAKHDNHWHIYYDDDTEKVVYEDPSEMFPGIKIVDYDEVPDEPFDDNLLFSYDDIEAENIVPIANMDYGNMVYATRYNYERDAFEIPHLDHFHYVTIKTIIQFKDNWGGYTPKQVVATLKYLIENPDERPKKAGWGDSAGETEKEEYIDEAYEEEAMNAKLAFVQKHYSHIRAKDIKIFYGTIQIQIGSETIVIPLSDLEYENGKVTPIVDLPVIDKTDNN